MQGQHLTLYATIQKPLLRRKRWSLPQRRSLSQSEFVQHLGQCGPALQLGLLGTIQYK